MSDKYAAGFNLKGVHGSVFGNVVGYDFDYLTEASPAAADKLWLVKVPAGVRILEALLINEDCDSGTTVTCSFGLSPLDGVAGTYDEAAFLAASSAVLQSANTGTKYYPRATITEKDYGVVVKLGGTFAGWQTGKIIRGHVLGIMIGAK